MNLLIETIECLENNGKTLDDVNYICGDDFSISKNDFIELANFDYNDGYGAQEVASDLRLYGEGFWIERCEYDGSEWWNFVSTILEKKEERKIKRLVTGQNGDDGCGSDTLAELNEDK